MDPVTVITLADETYALPLAVTVRSLLDHLAPGRAIRIVVIDGGITPETKQRLNDSWRNSAAWPVCQVDYVAPCYQGDGDLPVWGRLTELTYARLSAAEYPPSQSRRAIFLDSDTLVLTDIGQLASTHLEGATIAATQDPYIPSVSSVGGLLDYATLGLKPNTKYFNAGIMLIDLERWRAERVAPRAFAFVQRYRKTLQHYDQDALNAVLAGRWKQLDPRWQAHPRLANSHGTPPWDDPYIVHFSGLFKPWIYRGRDCADAIFYRFVDRTAWCGSRPRRSLRSWAMGLYDSPSGASATPSRVVPPPSGTAWHEIGPDIAISAATDT